LGGQKAILSTFFFLILAERDGDQGPAAESHFQFKGPKGRKEPKETPFLTFLFTPSEIGLNLNLVAARVKVWVRPLDATAAAV
jgi:hypothetical protein